MLTIRHAILLSVVLSESAVLAAAVLGPTACLLFAAPANGLDLHPFDPRGSELPSPGPELEALILQLKEDWKEDPGDPRRGALLGTAYRQRGTIEGRELSERVMREVIELDPAEPAYHVALGLTHVSQRFEDYARGEFAQALTLDPAHHEARLEYGLSCFRSWLESRQVGEILFETENVLDTVLTNDPTQVEAGVRLALVRLVQRDLPGATEVVDQLVISNPDSGMAHMMRGFIAFESRLTELADYEWSLGLCLAPWVIREAYRNIAVLLPASEAGRYRELTPEGKRERERLFWQTRDPTPTTAVNERLLEHCARVLLSDIYFSVPHLNLRGWDTDRGRSLIRYGEPQSRSVVGADFDRTAWRIIEPGHYPGIYPEDEVMRQPMYRLMPSMVIWNYHIGDASFQLGFADEILDGNYAMPTETDPGDWAERAEVAIHDFPELTQYIHPGVEFRLPVEVCRFRGSGDSIQVCFFLELPGPLVPWQPLEEGAGFDAEKRMAIFDTGWNEIERVSSHVIYRGGPSPTDARACIYQDLIEKELTPGDFQVALVVEGSDRRVRFAWEDSLALKALGENEPFLSDILFVRRLTPAATPGAFTRGGMDLRPHIMHRYAWGEDIQFYYEVYGLEAVGEGVSLFEVEYEVESLGSGRPDGPIWRRLWHSLRGGDAGRTLSYRFQRRGEGVDVAEHLTLEGTTFEPGRYSLKVEVEDLVSGRSASRRKAFEVLPEREQQD